MKGGGREEEEDEEEKEEGLPSYLKGQTNHKETFFHLAASWSQDLR